MGKNVKNAGMLVLHIGGRLMFTGFSGHGARGEHGTGRLAVDIVGLRMVALGTLRRLDSSLMVEAAQECVLKALAARYGWVKEDGQAQIVDVPAEQTGIGIEVDGDRLVCLPVAGAPGRHECPDLTQPLEQVAHGTIPFEHLPGWPRWASERTAAEQQELRAVVEGLRGVLF